MLQVILALRALITEHRELSLGCRASQRQGRVDLCIHLTLYPGRVQQMISSPGGNGIRCNLIAVSD